MCERIFVRAGYMSHILLFGVYGKDYAYPLLRMSESGIVDSNCCVHMDNSGGNRDKFCIDCVAGGLVLATFQLFTIQKKY